MNRFSNYNYSGKKALVRVDFNVPVKEGKITDDTRIQAALPTIKKILNDGGSVILMSHLGRPKKDMAKKPHLTEKDFSLEPIAKHLSSVLGQEVQFAKDSVGDDAKEKAARLKKGAILLLENLRLQEAEEKGDAAFAKQLSELGDVYVNDAFGTAHRAHASTAVIAGNFD